MDGILLRNYMEILINKTALMNLRDIVLSKKQTRGRREGSHRLVYIA